MEIKNAKFIWFDLGYTLVTFSKAFPDGTLHPTDWLFKQVGETERDREIIDRILFTTPCLNTLEKFSDYMHQTFSFVVRERMDEICQEAWRVQEESVTAYPQSKALLETLRDAGWFYGFVSNATHAMWQGVKRALGEELTKVPLVLSCTEARKKPDEKMFDTASAIVWGRQNRNYKDRLNGLYVGDDIDNDIIPALKVGMSPIFLKDQAAERVSRLGGQVLPEGAETMTGYTTCGSIGDIIVELDGLVFKG